MTEPITAVCRVIDAQFKERLEDDDNNPTYENSIFIRLKSEPEGYQYQVALSEPQVRELVGLQREMSSMEMIKFATKLRERTEPLKLMVDPDSRDVDTDLLNEEGPDQIEPVAKRPKRKPRAKVNPARHEFNPKQKQS